MRLFIVSLLLSLPAFAQLNLQNYEGATPTTLNARRGQRIVEVLRRGDILVFRLTNHRINRQRAASGAQGRIIESGQDLVFQVGREQEYVRGDDLINATDGRRFQFVRRVGDQLVWTRNSSVYVAGDYSGAVGHYGGQAYLSDGSAHPAFQGLIFRRWDANCNFDAGYMRNFCFAFEIDYTLGQLMADAARANLTVTLLTREQVPEPVPEQDVEF